MITGLTAEEHVVSDRSPWTIPAQDANDFPDERAVEPARLLGREHHVVQPSGGAALAVGHEPISSTPSTQS